MSQLTREDLKTMSPDAIVKAKREGHLNALLGHPEATVNQVLDAIEHRQVPEPASASAEPANDGQLSRADLADMSPAEINQARSEGRLNQVLGRPVPVPVPAEGQLSRADVDRMSPADIVKAKREGRLDALLGRTA
ncbi:hypothetical protein [Streptomyces sp. NPDC059850]|uniref:hypothetical protein n=1 Tax=Streptomyces sp. NPDC059850 TaxID=3346970 RepID=UPI003665491D